MWGSFFQKLYHSNFTFRSLLNFRMTTTNSNFSPSRGLNASENSMFEISHSFPQFAYITNKAEQKESSSSWLPAEHSITKEMSLQDALFIAKCILIYNTCPPSTLKSVRHANVSDRLNSKTFHVFFQKFVFLVVTCPAARSHDLQLCCNCFIWYLVLCTTKAHLKTEKKRNI